MAKRRLEPFEISPTQIHKGLGVGVASISRLSPTDKRYKIYRGAYLYRLILSEIDKEEATILDSSDNDPSVSDLVEFYKLSKQNFYSLKKNNYTLYSIYVDAWKYKKIIIKRILSS